MKMHFSMVLFSYFTVEERCFFLIFINNSLRSDGHSSRDFNRYNAVQNLHCKICMWQYVLFHSELYYISSPVTWLHKGLV